MGLKLDSTVSTLMVLGVMCIIATHCHPQQESESARKYHISYFFIDLKQFCVKWPIFFSFLASYYEGVRVFEPTPACSQAGGFCVAQNDCVESAEQTGLCGNALECCYRGKPNRIFHNLLRIF